MSISFPKPLRPATFQLLTVLSLPMLVVVIVWLVFYFDVKFDLDLYTWGVYPRSWKALPGIFFAPLIHGSLSHLFNNSIPLYVLLAAVLYFYPVKAWQIFVGGWLLPGLFAWFIARPSFHIGASGLVYALAAFIFLSGILRNNRYLLALSLLIAFLYGSLFFGMFPLEEAISWESHLGGGLTGLLLAVAHRKVTPTAYVHLPEPDILDEADDIYIAQIGDAWMLQQPEDKQQPPSISGEKSEVVRVKYHITPNQENRKTPE